MRVVGYTEVIQKRRSRKSGLTQKPAAPNFPQCDFWTG